MKEKIALDKVTLVAMTSVKVPETIRALQLSSKNINYAAVKLITHFQPEGLPSNIQYCHIPQINSIDQYSYDMIYNLGRYIETDYALVVQYDGYVVNPHCWKEDFLNYDYIGAPFPLPRDNFSYRDVNGDVFRVGNGGFSLRSKKLIDLPNVLKMEWKPFHGFYNEDGFICAMNRHIYEANGCRFAPIDVAKYFSHETDIPEIAGITPFGFHGKKSIYYGV